MKKTLKERVWALSMFSGIGLLGSAIVMGKELFTGQVILAAVLILFCLVIETSARKI